MSNPEGGISMFNLVSAGNLKELNQKTNPEVEVQKITPGMLTIGLTNGLGDRLKFNELTMKVELDGKEIPEKYLDLFYVDLSVFNIDIEKKKAKDAVVYAARRNPYNPIIDYFESLKTRYENKELAPADIDSLATDFLGTKESLYDKMLAATLIGAANRAINKGCDFRSCCVLKGNQHISKTEFWEVLCGSKWFSNTHQDQDKDLFLNIQTNWIIELGELDCVTGKKETGRLKNLLSSTTDNFRPPYGTSMERSPRGSIFVGSVNPDEFFRDQTGNSRFWVIELDNPANVHIDIKKVQEERDSIWLAVLLAMDSGRLPRLSYEDQCESDRRNKGFVEEGLFDSAIAKWLANEAPPKFTIEEAIVGSGCRYKDHIKKQDQNEARKSLKSFGCWQDKNQTRVSKKFRPRLWNKPTLSQVSENEGVSETPPIPAMPMEEEDLSQDSKQNINNLKPHKILRCDRGKNDEAAETLAQFFSGAVVSESQNISQENQKRLNLYMNQRNSK